MNVCKILEDSNAYLLSGLVKTADKYEPEEPISPTKGDATPFRSSKDVKSLTSVESPRRKGNKTPSKLVRRQRHQTEEGGFSLKTFFIKTKKAFGRLTRIIPGIGGEESEDQSPEDPNMPEWRIRALDNWGFARYLIHLWHATGRFKESLDERDERILRGSTSAMEIKEAKTCKKIFREIILKFGKKLMLFT